MTGFVRGDRGGPERAAGAPGAVELPGREKTCGKKTRYASEELALKAAEAHNRWRLREHDVVPYPENPAEPGSLLSPQSVSPAVAAEPAAAPAAGCVSGTQRSPARPGR